MSKKKQIIIGGVLLFGILATWSVLRRNRAEADGTDTPSGNVAGVTAAVVRVERGTLQNSLKIAGEFKPFQEVDIHAKVAGYIRTIYVDVGDHVKTGQTLAVLEIPELTAELAGANAAVRRAQEEIHLAQSNVERAKSAHGAAHAMYTRLSQASEQKAGTGSPAGSRRRPSEGPGIGGPGV